MTYPSMMPGPAASHGNALNAGLDGEKSGCDRPVATACRRFLSLSANIHVGKLSTPCSAAVEAVLGSDSLPGPRQQSVAGAGQTVDASIDAPRRRTC